MGYPPLSELEFSPDAQLYLPAIKGREQVAAYEHEHRSAECEHNGGDDRHHVAPA
jgi:hypothetical protein